jgi:hypothetical protein
MALLMLMLRRGWKKRRAREAEVERLKNSFGTNRSVISRLDAPEAYCKRGKLSPEQEK